MELIDMKVPFVSYRLRKSLPQNAGHILTVRSENSKLIPFLREGKVISRKEFIDTSEKKYFSKKINGWVIHYEPTVFKKYDTLEETLKADLYAVNSLVPETALRELQMGTGFYLNISLNWGPKSDPTVGRGLTFHPSSEWLASNKMMTQKAGHIDVYSVSDYLKDRSLWGTGGVLLHELSHAYHAKHCRNGFDNKEWCSAYEQAMAKKLYDKVAVHGPQGRNGPIKAYAATNRMEYFAELSVAYHNDSQEEYNKWFPFNRKQLKEHDPVAYSTLHALWNRNA
mmetsp:Transcript_13697/g.20676  ORF Transcript_13697/g.20676 Transcript_13697/m.20676 type:complete len:282 (+) Transcript_13697:95-940(+)